tara:strand:+ start:39887 stop:40369 length:483 start_codon:yes stop_codon:yes gene_type:complete
MARHRPNRRAIKLHYNFTSEEAARELGVSKGTVLRWLKDGLPHLAEQRPYLILGADLRDFLQKRNKPKQHCELHQCFCFRCQEPKAAAGGMVDYIPRTALSGQISAICTDCGTIMNKAFSAAKLPLLERQAEVSFPQGQPRLIDRGKPRGNDHFNKEPLA